MTKHLRTLSVAVLTGGGFLLTGGSTANAQIGPFLLQPICCDGKYVCCCSANACWVSSDGVVHNCG